MPKDKKRSSRGITDALDAMESLEQMWTVDNANSKVRRALKRAVTAGEADIFHASDNGQESYVVGESSNPPTPKSSVSVEGIKEVTERLSDLAEVDQLRGIKGRGYSTASLVKVFEALLEIADHHSSTKLSTIIGDGDDAMSSTDKAKREPAYVPVEPIPFAFTLATSVDGSAPPCVWASEPIDPTDVSHIVASIGLRNPNMDHASIFAKDIPSPGEKFRVVPRCATVSFITQYLKEKNCVANPTSACVANALGLAFGVDQRIFEGVDPRFGSILIAMQNDRKFQEHVRGRHGKRMKEMKERGERRQRYIEMLKKGLEEIDTKYKGELTDTVHLSMRDKELAKQAANMT